jgi:hypothetical protein
MKVLFKLDKRIKHMIEKYETKTVIRKITLMIRRRMNYLDSLDYDYLLCIRDGFLYVYLGNNRFDVYKPDNKKKLKLVNEIFFLIATKKNLSQ